MGTLPGSWSRFGWALAKSVLEGAIRNAPGAGCTVPARFAHLPSGEGPAVLGLRQAWLEGAEPLKRKEVWREAGIGRWKVR